MQKDLISRQEAIDTIMGQPPEPHYPSWYAAQIEGLPPVQLDLSEYSDKLWRSAYERGKAEAEKPQWIPCSERYPDMDERVLVYTGAHEYHVWDCMSNRADNYFWEDEEGLYRNKYEASLWMPLPEPYRGGEQDDR